jgi:hypothetical protein
MKTRSWLSVVCALVVCALVVVVSAGTALALDGKGKGGGSLGKGGLAAGEPSPGGATVTPPGGASGGVSPTSAGPGTGSGRGPSPATAGAGPAQAPARECDRVTLGEPARASAPVYPNGVVAGPPAVLPPTASGRTPISPGPIAGSTVTPGSPGC